MSKAVTLKQIAAVVNTSVSTVSMALSDHPHISPVTKAEIQKIAKIMGYTPNLIARKLSSRKKRTIGLVVPKVAHPFFSEAIEAIYDEAHQRGYDIFMMVSGEDAALEERHLRTLLGLQVDGFLISVTEKTTDTSLFESILAKNKKLVFFDRIIESLECSSVVCDDEQGCYNLISFALDKGYTKIGYIAGYSNIYIGRERRRGFERALKDRNIPLNPAWIVEGGFDQNDGYAGMMKLYERGPLPQLICTVSFAAALGVLSALHELGLSIPNDIDIISFGDSGYNPHMKPALTAAHLDAKEIGRKAVELLISQLTNTQQAKEKIVVPTKLMINETGRGPA
ncbi:LacI family transcriptional regulator [candidate division KSB1 bacterium]|nr:LacI family transcriptional regulator [candidate division KSB1 bacterium]